MRHRLVALAGILCLVAACSAPPAIPLTVGQPIPLPPPLPLASPSAPAAPAPGTSTSPSGSPLSPAFTPTAVTFVTPDLGWALGSVPCATSCSALRQTTDGGQTWTALLAPPTPLVAAGQSGEMAAGAGVSSLRFANARDGWIFGPDLWATHDGGHTWRQIALPGAADEPVVVVETANGQVYATTYATTPQVAVRLAASPVGADTWTFSPATVALGAGPVPQTQMVLAGPDGWLLQIDRTVVGGVRLDHDAWVTWTPPCAAVAGPALLAANETGGLWAACDVGVWSTPQGEHLYVSHDGGTTFVPQQTPLPLASVTALVSPAPTTVLAAGTGTEGVATLIGSFDGGQTWQTMLTVAPHNGYPATFTYLEFTTPEQGMAFATTAATGGALWLTHDGGHTWVPALFAEQ